MPPRESTRDNPIGPFTLGRDLKPGDVVILAKSAQSIRNMAKVRITDRHFALGWVGEWVNAGDRPEWAREVKVFLDDKYILVERAS